MPFSGKNSDQLKSDIESFLSGGGTITKLIIDDGSYEKGLRKIKSSLGGGFNPFSKESALTK